MMLNAHRRRYYLEKGFSLVEIMVAVVIGMVGILIIMGVFVGTEGQKRATTGGADAQVNAAIAMFTLDRNVRVAGLGLSGTGCTTVNAFRVAMTPSTSFNFSPLPVTIGRDDPSTGTDRITLLYSTSSFANILMTLAVPMADSTQPLVVQNGDGFAQGDLILISEPPKACSLIQASADGTKPTSVWDIPHASGGAFVFNSPLNTFPAGGYAIGARVNNMGAMVRHEYYVQGGNLMTRDLNQPVAVSPAVPLVTGVIAMRAQYGRDTNADGYVDVFDNAVPANENVVLAVRIAVVTRSDQLERQVVTPTPLVLWNGGTTANGGAIGLSATEQLYRYRVYQTTIPLRNVIWNTGV